MVAENVGRLVVVAQEDPNRMVGILTRGDLLAAHGRRLKEARDAARHIRIRQTLKRKFRGEV
jgi:CBS domain-containing protein